MYSLQAPAIRVDDKVIIKVASLGENEKISQTDAARADNYDVRDNILAWTKMSDNICINAYWNCFKGDIYSRPLLKVIQENMLWWKKIGVIGFTPDGKVDCSKLSSYSPKQQFARKFYDMNEMYTWCLCKLMWNPDQDVSDLKTRYCKIVYKECANEMLEYFRLIEKGFDSQDAFVWYATGADVYIYLFIVKAGIQNAVLETLKKAVDKATTPNVKSKVESIYSILFESISRYEDFVEESAEMLYCQGINPLEKTELDYRNNADSIWNKAKPCTVLRNYMDLSFYNPAANFSCKMLYDDKNLYFGYQIYDDAIQRVEETKKGLRLYREDGSVVVSRAETYFGGNSLNQNVYYGLVSGFNKDEVIDRLFYNDGVAHEMPIPPGMLDVKQVFLSDDPKERSYFHIQVVPIAFLGVAKENLKPYGHFVYFADRYGRAGWMGFGLWSKENFSMFKLIEGKKEK